VRRKLKLATSISKITEDITIDFRKLSIENVQHLQQPSTAMLVENFTLKIKPVLPVIFPRMINVDEIEEKSSEKIRISEDMVTSNLLFDINGQEAAKELVRSLLRLQKYLFTNHLLPKTIDWNIKQDNSNARVLQ